MTKYDYDFLHYISVKNDKINTHLKLADAQEHGGEKGQYRVNQDRQWLKGFYTDEAILALIQSCMQGKEKPKKPDIKEKDAVSVFIEQGGSYINEIGYVSAAPIQDITGNYMCPVRMYNTKTVYVNCNDIKLIRRGTK